MTDKNYPVVGYGNMGLNGGSQGVYVDDPTGQQQQQQKDNQNQQYTMPNMLIWIHEEWKKIELQKIQWDLQRAEFQAQITTLKRERSGQESVKMDLIRRIKMLEFALKEERKVQNHLRTQTQSNGENNPAVPSSSTLTESRSDKDNPPGWDISSQVYERVLKDAQGASQASVQWKESIKRLKQYLTEVGYNETLLDMRHLRLRHLMERKSTALANFDLGEDAKGRELTSDRLGPSQADAAASEAAMSNFDFLKNEMEDDEGGEYTALSQNQFPGGALENDPKFKMKKITRGSGKKGSIKEVMASLQAEYDQTNAGSAASFNGLPANESLNSGNRSGTDTMSAYIGKVEADPSMLGDLANVTPANEAEGLNANEDALAVLAMARGMPKPDTSALDFSSASARDASDAPSFSSPSNNNNNTEQQLSRARGYGTREEAEYQKMEERPHWTLRHALRAHWDSVRSLAFHTEPYACLVTGGDDGSLILWSMEPAAVEAAAVARNWLTSITTTTGGDVSTDDASHLKLTTGELLPTHTVRAHDGPVLSTLVVSLGAGTAPLACSGGRDGELRVWALPSGAWVPYESEILEEDTDAHQFADVAISQAPSRVATALEHRDAIWSLASCSPSSESTLLASAAADGTVKLWSLSLLEHENSAEVQLQSRHSFELDGNDVATSVAFTQGGARLLVGTKKGLLLLLEMETAQILFSQSALQYGSECPVYSVATHSSSPLAIAGLENGHLCFLDTQATAILQNTVAHQQTVSSVAFDPQGHYFATASHDESLRLWEVGSRSCVQEMHAHRTKFHESALAVAFHPQLPLMASAGADAVVNVYSSAFTFSSTI